MRGIGVVAVNIQTVEDIYRLVWTAVAIQRPMEAHYQGRRRLFCPHRMGRSQRGDLRVLCYQYGGESHSGLEAVGSPANGGWGADNPTWPAGAEGEKRFRSATRNPYAAIHKVA